MPWYAAHAIVYFQFKEGPQDGYLVWENVYLVRAEDPQQAYALAEGYARADEGDSQGSLKIDDRPARLVFGGIRKLVTVSHVGPGETLASGDELTYSEYQVATPEALRRLIDDEDAEVLYWGT
jgi:hypothetical protein